MICVFAGSARAVPAADLALAAAVGDAIADASHPIVYGGGSTGCMGALADAALAHGAPVIGVVPEGLFRADEIRDGIELVEVDSLHHRKQVMLELADAFVVLPGGLGTLDEVGEVLTWAQLGIHGKPTVFVDPDGYWTGLLEWVEHAIGRGYVADTTRGFFLVVTAADDVLPALAGYASPPPTRGPLSREQT